MALLNRHETDFDWRTLLLLLAAVVVRVVFAWHQANAVSEQGGRHPEMYPRAGVKIIAFAITCLAFMPLFATIPALLRLPQLPQAKVPLMFLISYFLFSCAIALIARRRLAAWALSLSRFAARDKQQLIATLQRYNGDSV